MRALMLAALVAALPAVPAMAQGNVCGQREMIVERLESQYGETQQSRGLQRNNGVVEIFANAETGTWTILVTLPNGMTCLVAAGEAWDSVTRPQGTRL